MSAPHQSGAAKAKLDAAFANLATTIQNAAKYNHAGSVILYTARLDAALGEVLERMFVKSNQTIRHNLVERSDFALKIDLAHAFGAIDHALYVDLHHLREIRNAFAHSATANFQNAKVARYLETLNRKAVMGAPHQAYTSVILRVANELGRQTRDIVAVKPTRLTSE